MDRSGVGVEAAKRAAADSEPFLPHSYELTPHWRRYSGTERTMVGVEGEGEGEARARGWARVCSLDCTVKWWLYPVLQ
jgi:hypothetical protein